MKLIIDIDNVVCDFVYAMVEYTNFKLGKNIKTSDVTVWDFVDSPNIDIEYDQMMLLFKDFFTLKMWGNSPLYPDSKEVLHWIADNHDFIYLTNRPPEAEQSTIDYFEEEEIPYIATHILRSYNDDVCHGSIVFINGHNKAVFAKQINADIAIEDKPSTVQEYLNEGISTALKIEPYNEWVQYDDPKGILHKCKDLTGFKSLVEKLEGIQ